MSNFTTSEGHIQSNFTIAWEGEYVIEFDCLGRRVRNKNGDRNFYIKFHLRNGKIQGIAGLDHATYMMNLINDSITIAKNERQMVVPPVTYEECQKIIKDVLDIKSILI